TWASPRTLPRRCSTSPPIAHASSLVRSWWPTAASPQASRGRRSMPRVDNKTVIVTGGASGIGAETARLIVREGGKAVIADLNEAGGTALAAELGDGALFCRLDTT